MGFVARASVASLSRTLVRNVAPLPGDNFAVAVGADDGSFRGGARSTVAGRLELDRLHVDGSALIGVGWVRSTGSMKRSLVRRSNVAAYLSDGAAPNIEADNRFVENQDNRIAFGQALELPGAINLPAPNR